MRSIENAAFEIKKRIERNKGTENMKVIKRLSECVREYTRDSILTPVLMVFEVLFECVLPLVISSLINTLKSFSAATAGDEFRHNRRHKPHDNFMGGRRYDDVDNLSRADTFAARDAQSYLRRAWREKPLRWQAPGSAKISGKTCTIRYRIFRSPISINFPRPVWLRV
jgi:hypothetical protein